MGPVPVEPGAPAPTPPSGSPMDGFSFSPPAGDPSLSPGTPGGDPAVDPNFGPGGPNGEPFAQYTIYVPSKDNQGNDLPYLLDHVRLSLGRAGFQGRTVIRDAEGDWQGSNDYYDTEPMHLVLVAAPDSPQTDESIRVIAQGVKELARQEAVFVTKSPLTTFLV